MPLSPISRRPLLAGLALALAIISGCTVRPMLATNIGPGGEATASALSSIAVIPVETRHAQQVRNHLIFLLNGGAGQPVNPRYRLALNVTSSTSTAARIQVRTDDEPSASTLTLGARYQLVDTGTGTVVASGTRSITSAYDVPRQEFAALRAERDAEDRAARELAELLRLAVGQDIAQSQRRS